MNEWQLQERLTNRWMRNGIEIGSDRHFLVAWEVMVPSWRINDASKYWAEPSIDFLAADEHGTLTAIELKMKVPGRKPAWRVLCQVTHRSILLRDTFSEQRLEAAHFAAVSGRHGRVRGPDVSDLAEAHRRFFGMPTGAEFAADDIERVVAATDFGHNFDDIMDRFSHLSPGDLQRTLADEGLVNGARSNREVERLIALMASEQLPRTPVRRLLVEP